MNVLTVSQVNMYIRSLLEESAPLSNIYIAGEISNFLYYQKSGHMYFTLKDKKSQIKAVMFASNASLLRFLPEDGMHVVCRGRISLYEKDGAYQLYAVDMQPQGIGALALAYEQLKMKLFEEGLFDDKHKKTIPRYPKKIGIATSNMGAALQDIKNILFRRFPLAELVIAPTAVQGEAAASEIVRSLKLLDEMDDVDVIIVGRGGGSIEDLWAFNTEKVARAVYNCKTPVISAVGHETDHTICDEVADLRAPTPSAAAELAVPDIHDEASRINNMQGSLILLLRRNLQNEEQRLDMLSNSFVFSDVRNIFSKKQDELDFIMQRMTSVYSEKIRRNSEKLSALIIKIDAFNPIAVLSRGYSIAFSNGEIIKSYNQIKSGNILRMTFSDGSVSFTPSEVEYEQ